MTNFELKEKYDTLFDNLFFTKDFKDSMVKEFGYCPNGLTINTEYVDDNSPIHFVVRCKEYGYEYINERVIGDYTLLTVKTSKQMLEYMLDYITENIDNNVFTELLDYNFYY